MYSKLVLASNFLNFLYLKVNGASANTDSAEDHTLPGEGAWLLLFSSRSSTEETLAAVPVRSEEEKNENKKPGKLLVKKAAPKIKR